MKDDVLLAEDADTSTAEVFGNPPFKVFTPATILGTHLSSLLSAFTHAISSLSGTFTIVHSSPHA
jgi:hypothetical protein